LHKLPWKAAMEITNLKIWKRNHVLFRQLAIPCHVQNVIGSFVCWWRHLPS
jgi:hypothetical protein